MTDGRVYTLEDEIDVLHEDLGRARRRLWDLEQAGRQGRVAAWDEHMDTTRKQKERVMALERELAEMCAKQLAMDEGFGC